MSNLSVPRIHAAARRRAASRRLVAPAFSVAVAAALAGCSAPLDEPEPLGETAEALENVNALNANALNANALNANALNANALNANALNANALSPAAMQAIQLPGEVGDLSRQLMKYVVSCALGPDQSFSFSWTDLEGVSHADTYPGLLGLATSWSNAPLNLQGQQWVSACLASRVNWYGVSVMLSSRGPSPAISHEGLPEMLQYPVEEGAFWGNLFTSTPAVFACNNPLEKGHARSLHRDCAAGHVGPNGSVQECGIIHIVGSCTMYCQPLDLLGHYHPRCVNTLDGGLPFWLLQSNAGATTSVITVFLD